jgi:hypothetical protein
MNSPWSNPTGGNWLLNGGAVPASWYPGMPGSANDVVHFDNFSTGPATLDVTPGVIQTLAVIVDLGSLSS